MPNYADISSKKKKLKKNWNSEATICNDLLNISFLAILVLYLTRKLAYTDDDATVLFHVFTSFAYFFPLIGAIVADSWLGRFK